MSITAPRVTGVRTNVNYLKLTTEFDELKPGNQRRGTSALTRLLYQQFLLNILTPLFVA